MTSYKALYGRMCRTPICWDEMGEKKLLGPELVHITTKKVKKISRKNEGSLE